MLLFNIHSVGPEFTGEKIAEILKLWRSDQIPISSIERTNFAYLSSTNTPYFGDLDDLLRKTNLFGGESQFRVACFNRNFIGKKIYSSFTFFLRTHFAIPESPVTGSNEISLEFLTEENVDQNTLLSYCSIMYKVLKEDGLIELILNNIKNSHYTMPGETYLSFFSTKGYLSDSLEHGYITNFKMDNLFWFTIFGPPYVKKYGAEIFLNAPAWKKERLPDGSILLQLSEHLNETKTGPAIQEVVDYFTPLGVKYIYWDKVYYAKKMRRDR